MSRSPIKLIPADFTAVPALANACDVSAVDDFATDLDAVALLVATGTDLTDVVGLGTDALASAGFDASAGSSLVVAQHGHPLVLVGIGDPAELSAAISESTAISRYLDYVAIAGLGWEMTEQRELTLDAYAGTDTLLYAQPIEETDG